MKSIVATTGLAAKLFVNGKKGCFDKRPFADPHLLTGFHSQILRLGAPEAEAYTEANGLVSDGH
jgi:hypothetical protein